ALAGQPRIDVGIRAPQRLEADVVLPRERDERVLVAGADHERLADDVGAFGYDVLPRERRARDQNEQREQPTVSRACRHGAHYRLCLASVMSSGSHCAIPLRRGIARPSGPSVADQAGPPRAAPAEGLEPEQVAARPPAVPGGAAGP